MKFIVTGSEGFIAQRFISYLQNNKFNFLSTALKPVGNEIELHLDDAENFNYDIIEKDDLIIHLAAISSPDECQNNYDYTYSVNVSGTNIFIRNSLKKGARVLLFSSDTVYGLSKNQDDYYDENSSCLPVGNYAIMKHKVENCFLNEEKFKIFRLSYVFAKNDKFTNYLTKCSANGNVAEVFNSLYRNVIYIEDIFDCIKELNSNWGEFPNKIFNMCGDELVSRRDLAEYYKKIVDVNFKIKVIEPPDDFFQSRPRVISTKSIYLSKLLVRNPLSIPRAMEKEFIIERR